MLIWPESPVSSLSSLYPPQQGKWRVWGFHKGVHYTAHRKDAGNLQKSFL
jgi:hypothetical protein